MVKLVQLLFQRDVEAELELGEIFFHLTFQRAHLVAETLANGGFNVDGVVLLFDSWLAFEHDDDFEVFLPDRLNGLRHILQFSLHHLFVVAPHHILFMIAQIDAFLPRDLLLNIFLEWVFDLIHLNRNGSIWSSTLKNNAFVYFTVRAIGAESRLVLANCVRKWHQVPLKHVHLRQLSGRPSLLTWTGSRPTPGKALKTPNSHATSAPIRTLSSTAHTSHFLASLEIFECPANCRVRQKRDLRARGFAKRFFVNTDLKVCF